MTLIRRLVRFPVLLGHVVLGVLVISLAMGVDRLRGREPLRGLARKAQAFWCRTLCSLLGIRLRVAGSRLLSAPVLVVSNHVSWLDILVVAAHWDVCFLSKSEVRRWPGIGWLATGLGTVYIERGRHGASSRALEEMRERLRCPARVLFFPEGTTSEGHDLLPFRSRLFQAAIEDGVPVQPLTIRFNRPDGRLCIAAAFVDNKPLWHHVVDVAGEPAIEAVVTVGEPVDSRHRSRKELALLARRQMAEMLDSTEPEDRLRA